MLLIDNYDSFTYNLRDYFLQLGERCDVIRNDERSLGEIISLNPDAIILSPGPETPSKAGAMMDVIEYFHDKIPILGICLGHQGLGEFFGASLVRAKKIMHGKPSPVYHKEHPLFENIPSPFEAMRYHSLVLDKVDGTSLQVVAETADHEVMAMIHPQFKLCGFQFHPESILTPYGLTLLKNWLHWAAISRNSASIST